MPTVQVEGAGPVHLGVTVSPLGRPLPHLEPADEGAAQPDAEPARPSPGPDAAPGVICLFSDLTAVVELEEGLPVLPPAA